MVELLAPAGEYNSFLGAINAGADAVYLAGNMYGARASAVNFSDEELIKAIKYAHLFGKKVYLTVNTLTKNEELEKLYDFLYPFYINGLDAVIVQDMGVFLYIKEVFKDLDIHVSTQAAVTSLYGAKFYENLGAKRIVLARELTLNEIKDITNGGIETECFIHGAMCYSYSGMCLFSSFLGGNSGNRGRCKGPCRQPYKVDSKEAYYLSLSDMNTIEIIDKLINAGIYSFKIEGRLKSPSYAAGVTSIYRKYIDFCLENPGVKPVIDKKDMDFLKMLYSRTSTGHGYYERTSSAKMITFEKGSYAKVDESLEKEIIEKYINKPKKVKINLEFIAIKGKPASLKIALCDNTDINVSVFSENIIEKGEKIQSDEDEVKKQLIKLGNTVFESNKTNVKLDGGFVPVGIIKQLRRQACEMLEERLNENDLRSNAYKKSYKDISGKYAGNSNSDKKNIKISKNNFIYDSDNVNLQNVNNSSYRNIAFVKKYYQFEEILNDDFYDALTVSKEIYENDTFFEAIEKCNKKIYIELPLILRKLNEESFKKTVLKVSENKNINGVFVNQYDAFLLLKEMNFQKEICGNSNIYSYNSLSYEFNKNLFKTVLNPTELSLNDYKSFDKEKMTMVLYGKARLMISANCVLKTCDKCSKKIKENKYEFVDLKDRLGVDFKVYPDCDEMLCFNYIYNSKPTSLHKYYNKLNDLGISSFAFVFTDESKKDIDRVTNAYKALFKGNESDFSFDYTAYHIKNGIL